MTWLRKKNVNQSLVYKKLQDQNNASTCQNLFKKGWKLIKGNSYTATEMSNLFRNNSEWQNKIMFK